MSSFLPLQMLSFHSQIYFWQVPMKNVSWMGDFIPTEDFNAKNILGFPVMFLSSLNISFISWQLTGSTDSLAGFALFEEGFNITFILLVLNFLNYFLLNLREFLTLFISSFLISSFTLLKDIFLLQISTLYLAGKPCYLHFVFSQTFVIRQYLLDQDLL